MSNQRQPESPKDGFETALSSQTSFKNHEPKFIPRITGTYYHQNVLNSRVFNDIEQQKICGIKLNFHIKKINFVAFLIMSFNSYLCMSILMIFSNFMPQSELNSIAKRFRSGIQSQNSPWIINILGSMEKSLVRKVVIQNSAVELLNVEIFSRTFYQHTLDLFL